MRGNSTLDEVWTVYEGTRDCIKITERILRSGDKRFTRRTNFVGRTEDEAEQRLRESRGEMDGFVIVLLWAQFERYLVEFVRTKIRILSQESPAALTKNLHEKIEDDVEHWRVSDDFNALLLIFFCRKLE